MGREAHSGRAQQRYKGLLSVLPRIAGERVGMDAFREYLLGLGLADQTVRNYVAKYRLAREWADHRGLDLAHITPSQIRELQSLVPNSHSSRRHLRTALTYWWRYLGVSDAPVAAIQVPRKPTPFPKSLPADEAERIIAVARRHAPEGWICLLGIDAGMRRSEIAASRWEWFDARWEWLTILGKGGRTRYVPVHPDIRLALRPHARSSGYIFPGTQGRAHITPATVNKWFTRICAEAEVDATPHQMRHTFAQRIYDLTGDLYLVQELLGHSDPATTQIYAHVGIDRKVAAMRQLAGFTGHLRAS